MDVSISAESLTDFLDFPASNGLARSLPDRISSPSSNDLCSLPVDFDPVKEWLVFPDEEPGGSDCKEAVEEFSADGLAVDCPNLDGKLLSGFEMMQNVSLDLKASIGYQVSGFEGDPLVGVMSNGDGGLLDCCADDRERGNGCDVSADEMKGLGVCQVSSVSNLIKIGRGIKDNGAGESNETETDSDDSSREDESCSSSEDEEDSEDYEPQNSKSKKDELDEFEEGEIRDVNCSEVVYCSDDDEAAAKGPIGFKHDPEVLPPVPHIEVFLEPHHQALPVGVISSILGNRVIVDGSEKHNPLNEGSILWITETRMPLGLVDEIFGPVKNPFYVVRYNSDKEVPLAISVGTAASFVMEFAHQILNDKDLCKKGYDASGENDGEVSEEVEFSDDEKEAEYKRSTRQAKRATNSRRYENQEFDLHKRTNFRVSAIQQDKRFPVPIESAIGPPFPAAPITGDFVCTSHPGNGCGISPHLERAVPRVPLTGCPNNQSQQLLPPLPTACWMPPLQTQQYHMGVNGGHLMNSFPTQQLAGQTYQQNQVPNNFPNGMQIQQQLPQNLAGPGNLPWLAGLPNLLAGLISLGLTAQGGLNQAQPNFAHAPYGGSNVYDQGVSGLYNGQSYAPTNVQGIQHPLQLGPRRSFPRGRNRYSRGGRHQFGRGGRPNHR